MWLNDYRIYWGFLSSHELCLVEIVADLMIIFLFLCPHTFLSHINSSYVKDNISFNLLTVYGV